MRKIESRAIFSLVIFFFFLFPLFASSTKEETDLVAYWDFNEGSGRVARDKSGNGNDGKICGAKWVKAKNGFALKFNGKGSVNCGNSPNLSFGKNDFSIELCVKPCSLKPGGSVLIKGVGAEEYTIRIGGGYFDRAIMFFGGWDNYRYSGKGAILKGCWTHIVYVKSGTNLDCYIDGKLSNWGATAIPSSVSGSKDLQIGGGCGRFKGIIDEVKIYNRALTAEEVAKSYKQLSLPTQRKHVIKLIKKYAKFCLIALMIIFIVIMRKFWVHQET